MYQYVIELSITSYIDIKKERFMNKISTLCILFMANIMLSLNSCDTIDPTDIQLQPHSYSPPAWVQGKWEHEQLAITALENNIIIRETKHLETTTNFSNMMKYNVKENRSISNPIYRVVFTEQNPYAGEINNTYEFIKQGENTLIYNHSVEIESQAYDSTKATYTLTKQTPPYSYSPPAWIQGAWTYNDITITLSKNNIRIVSNDLWIDFSKHIIDNVIETTHENNNMYNIAAQQSHEGTGKTTQQFTFMKQDENTLVHTHSLVHSEGLSDITTYVLKKQQNTPPILY